MTTEHETLADAIRQRRSELLDAASAKSSNVAAYVRRDLPGYESPITGKWIHGRSARREDLKSSGSVEYDPGMKDDARRNYARNDAKLDASIGRTVETIFNQFPKEKQQQLEHEVMTDIATKFYRRG